MPEYARPEIVTAPIRDAHGELVEFGTRWEQPPESAYSVVTHPERYAPLHDVAAALIAHLGATYDVVVEEGAGAAADLLFDVDTIVRAARITPDDPAAAPVTIVLTGFPGVAVHAGALQDLAFPSCGCDACDESVEQLVEELEDVVLGVAAGGLSERMRGGAVQHRLVLPSGGTRSGSASARDVPLERLRAAEERLLRAPDDWQAWPRRA